MLRFIQYSLLIFSFLSIHAAAQEPELKGIEENPLLPVRTDSPRATMKSFLSAMNDYRRGKSADNEKLEARIGDAIRTFDLSSGNRVLDRAKAIEAAIFLKEVIDRHILIDLSKIDEGSDQAFWHLKGSEITIKKIKDGSREGEYLFSRETVNRAREFYEKIKNKPYLEGSGQGALYSESIWQRELPYWAREKALFFPNWQWIGLFLSILLGLVLRQVVSFAMRSIQKLTRRWESIRALHKMAKAIDIQAGNIAMCLLWFGLVYLLQFEGVSRSVLMVTVQVLLSYALIRAFYHLVDVFSEYLTELTSRTDNTLDDQLVPLLKRSLKVFVVVFGVLVAFQNLGFNVMSVLAGLGLGGLAFALAAKDTCANLFGSIMILLDRPFQVGDWINVNGVDGTVEDIGFRCTRLRTFYNSQVSIPNSLVASSNIDNYGRREFRRQVLNLGVTYDTPPEKMEAFVEGLKNIILANPKTRKDLFHVVFQSFEASSLGVLVYFFLKVPTWAEELVERQNVCLEILRLAEKLDVSFAFPTQTLHLESTPEHPAATHSVGELSSLAATARDFGPSGKIAKPGGLGIFTPPYKESL